LVAEINNISLSTVYFAFVVFDEIKIKNKSTTG